ncbi:MAG: c-type cytochrome [Archangium sp.]
MRRVVIVVAVLVSLPLVLTAGGCLRLSRPVSLEPHLTATTPGDRAAGERLGRAVLVCTECHGEDLGGKVVTDSAAFGRVVAPNLTARTRTLGEWDLAIRHGVGTGQRPLVLMPSDGYATLTLDDLKDLVEWLDALPRVERELPTTRLGPVGAMLVFTGKLHVPAWTIAHEQVAETSTPRPDARARGKYLIEISGCRGCHGANLEGHAFGPGQPPAPPLTSTALAGWNFDGFQNALRKGVARDGHPLAAMMPWRSFAALPDDDVHALWDTLSQ